MSLILPVGPRRMSSFAAHQRRGTPSSEPGTDFYCPIGTPVLAPDDGYIYGWGNSITPATGRWVGVAMDNGMAMRALHLSKVHRTTGRVTRGEVLGLSGASGYGEEDWSWNVAETGGAHTHVTLWPTHTIRYGYDSNGNPYSINFMDYAGASGGTGDDDMSAAAEEAIFQIRDVLGAQGGLNMPTDATVLANIRSIYAMTANVLLNTQNANAYLYAGGPGVDATLGAPNSIFGLVLNAATGQPTVALDEAEIARQVNASLIPAVVAAIRSGSITVEQVQAELANIETRQ